MVAFAGWCLGPVTGIASAITQFKPLAQVLKGFARDKKAHAQQQSIGTRPATNTTNHRAIPDDNLGYPALITGPNFTGSGFYFNTNNATFLVTAKHVLFDRKTGKLLSNTVEVRSYSKDPADRNPNVLELDLTALEVKAHATQDVSVVKILNIGEVKPSTTAPADATVLPGVQIKAVNSKGVVGVGPDVVKLFDQILVGNNVILFGYPTSLDLKELAQLDPLRPLLRRGLVAGQNFEKRSVVLDCPVYPGNSGGPVVEIDPEGLGYRLFVIGVVSEFVPFADSAKYFTMASNSGYSIATPMDFVLVLTR
jgi:hypothetical protein